MRTIKPFILSSLALHLLGLGLLLMVTISPPTKVKTLTVLLVSAEEMGSGSGGKGQASIRISSSSRSSPPAKGADDKARANLRMETKGASGELAPAESALKSSGEMTGLQTTPPAENGGTSGLSSSRGESSSAGISAASGNSRGTADERIASLPGGGMGYGRGFGNGNGWSAGGGEPLYLKGGYQLTPLYPASARRQGREGTTYLKIKISPEGKVQEILIDRSSGHRDLDEAAVEAVKAWRFEPPQMGEQRVSVWAQVPIRFQLKNK